MRYSVPFLVFPYLLANTLPAKSPLLSPDASKSEEPSQKGWELEDKKLGRNTVMGKTDERKRLSGDQRI